jgi:hypothetical protein
MYLVPRLMYLWAPCFILLLYSRTRIFYVLKFCSSALAFVFLFGLVCTSCTISCLLLNV